MRLTPVPVPCPLDPFPLNDEDMVIDFDLDFSFFFFTTCVAPLDEDPMTFAEGVVILDVLPAKSTLIRSRNKRFDDWDDMKLTRWCQIAKLLFAKVIDDISLPTLYRHKNMLVSGFCGTPPRKREISGEYNKRCNFTYQ